MSDGQKTVNEDQEQGEHQVVLSLPELNRDFTSTTEVKDWLEDQLEVCTLLGKFFKDIGSRSDEMVYTHFAHLIQSSSLLIYSNMYDPGYEAICQAVKEHAKKGGIFAGSSCAEEIKYISRANTPLFNTYRIELINLAVQRNRGWQVEKAGLQLDRLLTKKIVLQKSFDEFTAKLEVANKDLLQHRNNTKETMALIVPAQYWSERSEDYKHMAVAYFVAFCVAIGLTTFAASHFAPYFLPLLKSAVTDPPLATNNYPFFPMAVFFVFVALFAWPLRVLSKLFTSALHLSRDASERSIMACAYLRLLEKQGDFEPAERAFFYQTLFTPSQTGFSKPTDLNTPLDMITRAFEQSQKKNTGSGK